MLFRGQKDRDVYSTMASQGPRSLELKSSFERALSKSLQLQSTSHHSWLQLPSMEVQLRLSWKQSWSISQCPSQGANMFTVTEGQTSQYNLALLF